MPPPDFLTAGAPQAYLDSCRGSKTVREVGARGVMGCTRRGTEARLGRRRHERCRRAVETYFTASGDAPALLLRTCTALSVAYCSTWCGGVSPSTLPVIGAAQGGITAAPAQGLAKEERKTQTNATTCHPQALPQSPTLGNAHSQCIARAASRAVHVSSLAQS